MELVNVDAAVAWRYVAYLRNPAAASAAIWGRPRSGIREVTVARSELTP